MRIRATKAAGSFDCSREGSFELLVHMEADPNSLSYGEFRFETVLTDDETRDFIDIAAYILNHRVGIFVVCARPSCSPRSAFVDSSWEKLDTTLAKRGIWLLSATCKELRREPHWSNALEVARCASAELAPADQDRVLKYLADVGRATILDCMRLCHASVDSYDALLRLVSNGTLYLDPPTDLSPGASLCIDPPASDTAFDGWLPRLHFPGRVGRETPVASSATR